MGWNRTWPAATVAMVGLALGADAGVPQEPHWDARPLSHWLRALAAEEVATRVAAAHSVAEIAIAHGGSAAASAVPALTASLDTNDVSVRQAAARALEQIGPPARSAAPALLRLFESAPEPATRRGAGLALARIAAADGEVVQVAGRALADHDAGVRVSAGVVLLAAGPAARPVRAALEAALADPHPIVRMYVAAAIARGGEPDRAAPLLLEGLRSSDRIVRVETAGLLVELAPGRRPVLDALAAALGDPEPEVRTAAADALGAIGPPARPVLDALWARLRDPDEGVRDSVVRAATLIRD